MNTNIIYKDGYKNHAKKVEKETSFKKRKRANQYVSISPFNPEEVMISYSYHNGYYNNDRYNKKANKPKTFRVFKEKKARSIRRRLNSLEEFDYKKTLNGGFWE